MRHKNSKRWAGNNRTKFNPTEKDIKKAIKEFKKKGGKITKLEYLNVEGDPIFSSEKYAASNIFEWS